MKKVNISKTRKNALLRAKPGAQNVEVYSTILGEIIVYPEPHGLEATYYKGKMLGYGVQRISHYKDDIYHIDFGDDCGACLFDKEKLWISCSFNISFDDTIKKGFITLKTSKGYGAIHLDNFNHLVDYKSVEYWEKHNVIIAYDLGGKNNLSIFDMDLKKIGYHRGAQISQEETILGEHILKIEYVDKGYVLFNSTSKTFSDKFDELWHFSKEEGHGLLSLSETGRKKLLNLENMKNSREFEKFEKKGNFMLIHTSSDFFSHLVDLRKIDSCSPWLLSYKELSNGLLLLRGAESMGFRALYNPENSKKSNYFDEYEYIDKKLIVLTDGDDTKTLEHANFLGNEKRFVSYKRAGTEYLVLEKGKDQYSFVRISDMEESEVYDCKNYKIGKTVVTCTSKYGTTATFNLKKFEMSAWKVK